MASEQLSERLLKALEQNTRLFASLSDELKFQLKTVVDSQVENLGLVTREEFDAMRISLDRALARVEALEAAAALNTKGSESALKED